MISEMELKFLKEGHQIFFISNWRILVMVIYVRGAKSFLMMRYEGQFPMV